MYTLESRIRYSETDADGMLSMAGIMNYFQDCSTFHSEDSGVGVSYLKKIQKAWMLSSWKIEMLRRPALGEKIIVGTWPYDIKGIYAYRNFVMLDEEKKEIVKADSIWFLCDAVTGRPMRIQEEDVSAYGSPEPKLAMKPVSRKITLPEQMEERSKIVVLPHHIDTNHHVNNAKYVEIAQEVTERPQEVRELQVEYKRAAVLGDTLVLKVGKTDQEEIIALCKEDGQVCAVVAQTY